MYTYIHMFVMVSCVRRVCSIRASKTECGRMVVKGYFMIWRIVCQVSMRPLVQSNQLEPLTVFARVQADVKPLGGRTMCFPKKSSLGRRKKRGLPTSLKHELPEGRSTPL